MPRATTLFVVALLLIGAVFGKEKKRLHHYDVEDEVPFFVNKIGPYSNPTESYEYYSLPFCQPDNIEHKHASIGDDLSGDHKVSSLYDIRFRVPIHWTSLCGKHPLSVKDIKSFQKAIDKYYYFEMLYDDLPLRGFIGTVDKEIRNGEEIKHYYLFKHLHFHILYNGDQIIYANVTADPHKLEELKDDADTTVEFSYSASWEETDYPFKERMKLYEDFFSKELEIHWLSIMNSFVLVLLLTGFLAIIIMRILKSDYSRYAREDDNDDEQEYGWKLIHGDVFRFPPHKNLFSAFIGLGAQSLAILFGILFLALVGMFYPNSGGTIFTAAIVLYSLTSVLGGFVSATFFKQFGGDKWAWNIVLVATLYTVPIFIIFSVNNTIAVAYDATAAVPFGTIMTVLLILLFVGFPLNIVGGIAGRRAAGEFEAPCRTKNFPREIPPIPWYRSLPCQMLMSGFLPFRYLY